MSSETIAILIPAFEAAATIGRVVRAARAACPAPADLLVVDDGSSDGTAEAARSGGAPVVSHPSNMGKGAALATGMGILTSRGARAIITLDADGQHDPVEIPRFVSAWREMRADLIVGARLDGFEAMAPLRRFGNRFSTKAVRLFGGPDLPDTQCGFRLYSRRLLEQVPFRRRAYDAEAEILMLASRRGFRIAPLRISSPDPDGRASSHYRPWLDTYRMCRTVVLCSLSARRRARRTAERSRRQEDHAARA